ncbi:hypothetical protein [Ureaplasma canigenitalium]|uniref:hypothetical protein n=1 Tax=Ureaplasma canigenitalium TaxID=42092 RepID=UPI0004E1EB81|nr:hypothetical protein [Ureaplasma canigenitalium]
MKSILKLLVNSVLIAGAPTSVSLQAGETRNPVQTGVETNRVTKIVDANRPKKPVRGEDIDNVEDFDLYFRGEALRIQYYLKHAYEVLKRILKTNERKIVSIPYQKFLNEIDIFKDPKHRADLENIKANFQELEYYNTDFVRLWEQEDFDYEKYLLNSLKKVAVDNDDKLDKEFKSNRIYSTYFDSKFEEVSFVRLLIIQFVALQILKKHKDNITLKKEVLDLLKTEEGISAGSSDFRRTIEVLKPKFDKILKISGDNTINQIAKQVDDENINDKRRLEAFLAVRKTRGSEQYDENFKKRIKAITKDTSLTELTTLRDDAEALFNVEYVKLTNKFKTLKNKDDKVEEKLKKSKNIGVLKKIEKEIDILLLAEFRKEVEASVAKAEGSDMYDEFVEKLKIQQLTHEQLSAIKQEADNEFINEKKSALEAVNMILDEMTRNAQTQAVNDAPNVKTLKSIAADSIKIRGNENLINARAEAEDLLKKTEGSKKHEEYNRRNSSSQNQTDLLLALVKEMKEEYDNIHKETMDNLTALDDKKDFQKKFDEAKNIGDLSKLNEEIKVEKQKQEIDKAKKHASMAVEKTKGSTQYNQLKQELSSAGDDVSKLNSLTEKADNLYTAAKNKALQAFQLLLDKKDYQNKIDKAADVGTLNSLTTEITKVAKEQSLAQARKLASIAVEKTKGSNQYQTLKSSLTNDNDDEMKLNNLTLKANELFNSVKNKTLSLFNQLLDKKDYQSKIDSAPNIESLMKLDEELSRVKKEQEEAKIKQDAKDAINKIEGSDQSDQLKKDLSMNKDNLEKLKELTKKVEEEFNKELSLVMLELNKLDDGNPRKNELQDKVKNAKSINELRALKTEIQSAVVEQQNQSKEKPKTPDSPKIPDLPDVMEKKTKSKTNIAAAVATPLVLIPAGIGIGVGTWYYLKRKKKQEK